MQSAHVGALPTLDNYHVALHHRNTSSRLGGGAVLLEFARFTDGKRATVQDVQDVHKISQALSFLERQSMVQNINKKKMSAK